MQRTSKFSPNKLPVDSQRLVTLAQEVTKSATYFERTSWEKTLRKAAEKLLKNKRQETLGGALDNLFKNDLSSYDTLLETIESLSESCRIEHEGKKYDVLLIAAPVLAWTHYAIPSGEIPDDLHAQFEKQLKENILAENTRLLLQPSLYSIDQLPMTHADTFKLTRQLANALFSNTTKHTKNTPPTVPFLADTRYLIGIAATQAGETFFRWQELSTSTNAPIKRKEALEKWQTETKPLFAQILTGCNIELLLPSAYFHSCRKADVKIRPVSIRAAVQFLTRSLNIEPQQLHAAIAGFGELSNLIPLSEYRIAFSAKDDDILYGVVWSLYGQESEEPFFNNTTNENKKTPLEEITAILKESGVPYDILDNERFPMEFCEDCGAPLFADKSGNLVHAELPEELEKKTSAFH